MFEPSELTINAGDTVRFVNDALPPHNVIVKDHPEFSHEGLAFASGESFEITFPEAGDFRSSADLMKALARRSNSRSVIYCRLLMAALYCFY